MADARCPHCDHVFAQAEVIEEWCASCGKRIPEAILKGIRPKPHLRKPLPAAPAPAAPAQRGPADRETKVRAAGLAVMVASIFGGLAALAWGTYDRMSGAAITAPVCLGVVAVVAFAAGLVMFNRGGKEE